jgi:hypothetical protein
VRYLATPRGLYVSRQVIAALPSSTSGAALDILEHEDDRGLRRMPSWICLSAPSCRSALAAATRLWHSA